MDIDSEQMFNITVENSTACNEIMYETKFRHVCCIQNATIVRERCHLLENVKQKLLKWNTTSWKL